MNRNRGVRPTAIVMVGLPARGKTYTARKLARYLNWQGYAARVFNVGSYRRKRLGASQRARFFDPDNPVAVRARDEIAEAALVDVFAWLKRGGQIAIYDATNGTKARRKWVSRQCETAGVRVVFVESICNDPTIIGSNIAGTKLLSPDYIGADPGGAIADFRARIAHYKRVYETLSDDSLRYVKIIDGGRQIVANNISGYVLGRLVNYLMNLQMAPQTIWLTRHGESEYNVVGRLGGDTSLTAAGRAYADRLAAFLVEHVEATPTVWTSTLRRTIQTAEVLPWEKLHLPALDEIEAGICNGMTYEEVAQRWPEDFAARKADKLRFRYPRGESYQDVIDRLNPLIINLERKRRPVVVIAHQAVLRALYAYFADKTPEECPRLEIPLHTVIELVPRAYCCDESRFTL